MRGWTGGRTLAAVAPGPADGARSDEPTIDLTRAPQPDEPPVPGAQWDEVRAQWEVWDDAAQAWGVVGDQTGARILPLDELPMMPVLDRELHLTDSIDEPEDHVIDVDRLAAPPQPVPGAQWTEVIGRWERWNDAAGAWVEARADAPSA